MKIQMYVVHDTRKVALVMTKKALLSRVDIWTCEFMFWCNIMRSTGISSKR